MSETLTRTGPLRQGFDYQDLFGVAVLIEWLEHPDRYEWVKFEADEFGSLDDVATCSPANRLRLAQIKHSSNPESPDAEFTLLDLLSVPASAKPKRRSLFQKWFRSWQSAAQEGRFASIEVEFITNRRAPSLVPLASSDPSTGALMIDPGKVALLMPEEWKHLVGQAQDTQDEIRRFFSVLELRFDSPELSIQREALEARARNLGISHSGYLNLETAAKQWAVMRDRPRSEGFIRLEDVRLATDWCVPRGLDQRFEVPPDFIRFRDLPLEALIDTFRDVKGGVRPLWGSPGAGKSTFLSDLYERIREAGIACVRHHYFVQPKEAEEFNRLNYARASEALLHDLLHELKDLTPNLNPDPDALASMIHGAAKSLADQGKTLVLIIDGLDHVVRDTDTFQLRSLLTRVLPAVNGLWVLLGTRPIQEGKASSLLRRLTTQDGWIEIPRFGYDECRSLLESNAGSIKVSEHELDEFVRRFLDTTKGHPLHAPYTIEALRHMGLKGFVTCSDIDRIPPYGRDLRDFYERLWQSLTHEAKEVAILVSTSLVRADQRPSS
jgi:NACHT domain